MNVLQKCLGTVKRFVSRRKNGKKSITLYYAVSGSGQGHVFMEEPRRDKNNPWWIGKHDASGTMIVARMEALGFVLPKITWEDAPVELKLSLT